MANTAHLKGLIQSPRGLCLLGIFSLFFLFLSVQSQSITQNPWPGLQYDARFTGHYPGKALGATRPQNFILYANPVQNSAGNGHFTVAANVSGQFIYSAEYLINVYQINGESLNLSSTLPVDRPHDTSEHAIFLTTLQPFAGCQNRLAATMFLNVQNSNDSGVFLYYWCLDGGNTSFEFSTPDPIPFNTAPVAQVAVDGSYELLAAGAFGQVVLIFTPSNGFPTLTFIPIDSVTIAIDAQMNVYFTSNTTLYAYSTNGEEATFAKIWSTDIQDRLCDNFYESCYIHLDSGAGMIYLYGQLSQNLYGFTTTSGSLTGNYSLGSYPRNYGALSNNSNANALFIPTINNLVAVNLAANPWTTTWSYPVAGNILSNIITDEIPNVYAVSQSGELLALNALNGNVIWHTVVQRVNGRGPVPSLSLGPGGSLVPSFGDNIWIMQPAKAVFPPNYYPYYPMNMMNSLHKTFNVSGNPQEDIFFDTISCWMITPEGKVIKSLSNSQTQVDCYSNLPFTASSLEVYYSFLYTDGTPLNETYLLPGFLGVGITGLTPNNLVAGTTSRPIIVNGTGLSVCSGRYGPCYCAFGIFDPNSINTSPNATKAYFVSENTLNCTTVPSSNSIAANPGPVEFSLVYPPEPNTGRTSPFVTTNNNVQFTYVSRSVPPVVPPPKTTPPTPPNSPPHKKHTAAIVVPIVVVLLVLVACVAGFVYYRYRMKQQEYSPITGDRRSYTAF